MSAMHAARRRRIWFGYLLLAPSLALLALVVVWPVASSIWMSLTDRSLMDLTSGAFVGLRNFRTIFTDPEFRGAAWNTVWWTIANVLAQVLLGTALALLLHRRFPGAGVFRTLVVIPWVVPSVAAVLIWRYLYDPSVGLVNAVLMRLGWVSEPVVFLGNPHTALTAVIIESIWKGTPFVVIIMLAGLQVVAPEEREAAAVDGAGPWRVFRYIVLPHLRPSLALATILTTVYTVNNFNAVWLMTGGGPVGSTEILFTYGYRKAFVEWDFGQGAAVSVVLFTLLLGLGLLHQALLDRGERP